MRALIANGPAMYREVISAAPHAVVGTLDGSRRTLPGMDFDTLLSILDAVSIRRSARKPTADR